VLDDVLRTVIPDLRRRLSLPADATAAAWSSSNFSSAGSWAGEWQQHMEWIITAVVALLLVLGASFFPKANSKVLFRSR